MNADRYMNLIGFRAIDEYPKSSVDWFNRACALVRWAIHGGPKWILTIQARIALQHAKDLRTKD